MPLFLIFIAFRRRLLAYALMPLLTPRFAAAFEPPSRWRDAAATLRR
jgi:hypothetical protein